MDIRDIKEEVIYPKGMAMETIFSLQKELVDHYVGIEGLPEYPIDINTKKGQILIKDFSGRIIEELGEAWESYLIMWDKFKISPEREPMIAHLQNFNEEVSDAIHFWVELMIFSGFETLTMRKWFSEMSYEQYFDSYDILESFLEVGKRELIYNVADGDLMVLNYYEDFRVIPESELRDEFLRGGRRLSLYHKTRMSELLWETTYHLQIARNTLKNKPWKQTGMLTDEALYENEIRLATVAMFKFFSFSGFNADSLYHIYYKKNRVNNFRIKSKY